MTEIFVSLIDEQELYSFFISSCYTIALGNGTACRETESFLSQLIQDGFFHPHDIQYTIINEAGASIYSCSPEAKAEFPDLEPNVISASNN